MRAGELRHVVTLESPGPAVPDGDGGYTQAWTSLSGGPIPAAIIPATVRDLERVAAGTVIATATHIVKLRYLDGVTTKTRITKGDRDSNGALTAGSREFSVTGVQNPEERNIELWLTAVEVVA